MKLLYTFGMAITGLIAIYGGTFNGLHEKEFKHIPLNLLTALAMLCILLWPATWSAALIITLVEKKP